MILISAQNEYTDWSLPADNLISKLDSLIEILSDSLVIGPLSQVANLHYKHQQKKWLKQQSLGSDYSSLYTDPFKRKTSTGNSTSTSSQPLDPPKCFFYVFSYQSEKSLFSQRLGSVHGDDLIFLFGSPISSQYLQANNQSSDVYSETEIQLSASIINYFANFAKFGNPNGNSSTLSHLTSSPDSLVWPEYDTQQKKYLSIGKSERSVFSIEIFLNAVPDREELIR